MQVNGWNLYQFAPFSEQIKEFESAELVMPDIRQGGSAYSSPLI